MIRVAAVAAALIVAAWFGLGVRQATSAGAARARLVRITPPTPAEARRTAALLDHAGQLNPDDTIDVSRALLALQRRRTGDARRILLGVVGAHPDDFDAWTTIALAYARADPALARRARAQMRRLAPPVPPP